MTRAPTQRQTAQNDAITIRASDLPQAAPASVKWAKKVNWARVNDLVRNNLPDFPVNDPDRALDSARRAGLGKRDTNGLYSLYVEPIFATPRQITSGGHRLTVMRAQGLRWALGTCLVEDIGPSVDELHAYPPPASSAP